MRNYGDYNYTRYMQEVVQEYMDDIYSFYSREDVYEAMVAFNKAKPDNRIFRQADLKRLCDAVGLDIRELKKDTSLLKSVPSRKQLVGKMMEALYRMYTEFPRATDYMRRIIAKLAPEYEKDTVRLAILKKFVLGCSVKCKTVYISAVLEWAKDRLTEDEKAVFAAKDANGKREMLADKLTDDIFSEMDVKLPVLDTIGLMVKRMERCIAEPDKYYTKNAEGDRVPVTDFVLSDTLKAMIEAACEKHGIAGERIYDKLSAIACNMAAEQDACGFFDALSAEFREQTRVTYYLTRRGTEDRVMELFKTDQRDARMKLNKGWEVLQICDDLAAGKFRVNGKTKVYLYYFAFMFGMKAKVPGYSGVSGDRDIIKNLFQDYYSDNLMRYLEDDYHDAAIASAFEREPTGEGVNFKNFVECIYIYYLNNDGTGDNPGERLDKADDMIKKCIRHARNGAQRSRANAEYTQVFRDVKLNTLLKLEETRLVDYICDNYILVSPKNNESARIMIDAEERTATDMVTDIMDWLEEMYEGVDARHDNANGKMMREDARYARSLKFEWELAGLLKDKYGADEGFVRIVNAIDSRLNTVENSIAGIGNSRVTRSGFIALYFNYYKNLMEDSEDSITSFPELYEDFCFSINPMLEDARYQTINPKNILDMYVVFSLYYYMVNPSVDADD